MRTKQKGQFTPIVLLLSIVSLMFFVFLYPVLNDVIQTALPEMDATTSAIVQLFPAALALAILAGIWFFVVPQRQERI